MAPRFFGYFGEKKKRYSFETAQCEISENDDDIDLNEHVIKLEIYNCFRGHHYLHSVSRWGTEGFFWNLKLNDDDFK